MNNQEHDVTIKAKDVGAFDIRLPVRRNGTGLVVSLGMKERCLQRLKLKHRDENTLVVAALLKPNREITRKESEWKKSDSDSYWYREMDFPTRHGAALLPVTYIEVEPSSKAVSLAIALPAKDAPQFSNLAAFKKAWDLYMGVESASLDQSRSRWFWQKGAQKPLVRKTTTGCINAQEASTERPPALFAGSKNLIGNPGTMYRAQFLLWTSPVETNSRGLWSWTPWATISSDYSWQSDFEHCAHFRFKNLMEQSPACSSASCTTSDESQGSDSDGPE